jgi:hypothetical protein
MKTFLLSTLTVVFLLFCANITQAQTTPTKLDQVELMKQFIGSWGSDISNDTSCFWEIKSFGTGFEGYFKFVTKGKIVSEGKELWGYDKSVDKCILSEMIEGMDIALYTTWFTSKNICNMFPYVDISNPEKASSKWVVEFPSPDILVETTIVNNITLRTDKYIRIK